MIRSHFFTQHAALRLPRRAFRLTGQLALGTSLLIMLGGCAELLDDETAGVEDTSTTPSAPAAEETIFDNGNVFAVDNNPGAPTMFSIAASYRITEITNYHWNYGAGSPGGTIGLRGEDGQEYGPWSVTTRPGQGDVPNAYWDARPDTVIGPGTYTVLDSEPSTWAQNQGSNGQGMSLVKGIRQ